MSLFGSDELVVKELRELKDLLTEPSEKKGLNDKVNTLKKQIVDLEIQRDKKQEEFDRRDRELTHMILSALRFSSRTESLAPSGLEKKRQEVETKQASEDRFDKEMEFREERFTEEVNYLKGLMGQILERLPTVNVDRQIREPAGRK